MESYGHLCKSLAIHENQWNPWKPIDMHGNLWTLLISVETTGSLRKCMGIHGIALTSMEVNRTPWKSKKIIGNSWKSIEIQGILGYQWISMAVLGNAWPYAEIDGIV